MNANTPDTLATKLAEAALTILVRSCRTEVAAASRDDLEAACAARFNVNRPGNRGGCWV